MMRVRRWWYLVVLGVGVVTVTPFLLGPASASAPKPPLPNLHPTPESAAPPASAPQASASTPFACGEVATASITLTADESCAGTTGIYAGANGITINLNGHTLTGDGTHDGVSSNNFNGVIVENGVIDSFQFGVLLLGNGSHATNLRVESNASYGIYASGNNNVATANYLVSNPVGIDLYVGSGQQATANSVEGSSSYGIVAQFVTAGLVVSNNKVFNTTTGGGTGYGILVEGAKGVVNGNVANGNASDGIFLSNTGLGVKATVSAANNRAAFNGGYGIDSGPGGTLDGGGNVVQDNTNSAQCANIVCHEVSN